MNALLRSSKQALQHASRSFASSPHPDRKVALLGAAGGIGQPLGLLLKVCGNALFDGGTLANPRIRMCVYVTADIPLRQPPLTLRYCRDTRSRCRHQSHQLKSFVQGGHCCQIPARNAVSSSESLVLSI